MNPDYIVYDDTSVSYMTLPIFKRGIPAIKPESPTPEGKAEKTRAIAHQVANRLGIPAIHQSVNLWLYQRLIADNLPLMVWCHPIGEDFQVMAQVRSDLTIGQIEDMKLEDRRKYEPKEIKMFYRKQLGNLDQSIWAVSPAHDLVDLVSRMTEVAKPDLALEFALADRQKYCALPAVGGILSDYPAAANTWRFPDQVLLPISTKLAAQFEQRNMTRWMVVDLTGTTWEELLPEGIKGAAVLPEEAKAMGLTEAKNWIPNLDKVDTTTPYLEDFHAADIR